MAKRDGSWTVFKIGLFGLLALLAAGGFWAYAVYLAPYFKRQALEETYAGQLQNLFQQAREVLAEKKEPPKTNRRGGKAVWVSARLLPRRNRNEWDLHIDERMPRVPEELRADQPGEVRAIVLVNLTSVTSGEYVTEDGMRVDAHARSAEVYIVDPQKKDVLAHAFFGSSNQQVIDLRKDSVIADVSPEAIVNWYTGLPE